MKKYLIAIIAVLSMTAVFSVESKSQVLTGVALSTKDSVLNTDSVTIDFGTIVNTVVSLSFKGTRESGTIASTNAKLYAKINDSFDWELVESRAIADGSTIQGTFSIPQRTQYAKYIVRIVSGCTCEIDGISGMVLKR